MALIAGIDEAGYGPVLGPLVVSATAFYADEEAPRDLWRVLAPVVTRTPVRYNESIVVGDSKRLYSRLIGLRHLETAVLAFLTATDKRCESRDSLLAALSLSDAAEPGVCPWHVGASLGLPVEVEPLTIEHKAARLKARLGARGVRFLGARSVVTPAGELNASIRRLGNKALALFERVGALLKWISICAAGGPFVVCVDKQGGRDHYAEPLQQVFSAAAVEVVAETRPVSEYRISGPEVQGVVSFRMDSEDAHLPAALASMYSKYLRELDLRLFNGFWQSRVPGLKATAGYSVDARRFLSQIRPAMAAAGLDLDAVVRFR
jgi:hypothetical protein